MGGEKETYVSQSKSTSSKETILNKFRIHQNNGEMHIHDDANNRKFAISIAKAWKIWDKVSAEIDSVEYVDIINKTVARFELVCDNGLLDVNITLTPIEVSDNFKKLTEFFKR